MLHVIHSTDAEPTACAIALGYSKTVVYITTPFIAFLLTGVLNLSSKNGLMDQPEVLVKQVRLVV